MSPQSLVCIAVPLEIRAATRVGFEKSPAAAQTMLSKDFQTVCHEGFVICFAIQTTVAPVSAWSEAEFVVQNTVQL